MLGLYVPVIGLNINQTRCCRCNRGLAVPSPRLRDGTFHWTGKLGLHRLRGHLRWVLVTSHKGSFAAASHHGGQQTSPKLTRCLPTGLALHHWEHQAGDGERTFLKRGRRAPNHVSMPSQEPGSALGSGQAVAKLARGAQRKQSNPALSLLAFLCCKPNKPKKFKDLHQGPRFAHPKVLLRGSRGTENIWHLAASVPKSASV